MRRLVFKILLFSSIAATSFVILFVSGFWNLNVTGNSGAGMNQDGAITGWNLLREIWGGVRGYEYNFTFQAEQVFMHYALLLFLLINIVVVAITLVRWILGGFQLGAWSGFYNMAYWFMGATIVITSSYIWYAITEIQAANYLEEGVAGFSMFLFPFWAYIPIIAGTILSVLAGVFQQAEGIRQ